MTVLSLTFKDEEEAKQVLTEQGIWWQIDVPQIGLVELAEQGYTVVFIGYLPKYNADPEAPVELSTDYSVDVLGEFTESQLTALPHFTPRFPKHGFAGVERE